MAGVGALCSTRRARSRSPDRRPPVQSLYIWGCCMRCPWPRPCRVRIVQSSPKARSTCRRSAHVASDSSVMELRAGAGAESLGGSTVGVRSAGAVMDVRSSAIGHPVGGVEGWHRSIISGDDDRAGGVVVVACGGSGAAVGSGPGLPCCLANHGSVARR